VKLEQAIELQIDMTTIENTGYEHPRRVLPEDLSLYVGKKTLVKLILEAVQSINGEKVSYERFALDGAGYQKGMMLTLVTYCYATGVYGSGEIELGIQRDAMTRYLCARTYPGVDAIRSFRRHHRPEIRECLGELFRRVWKVRFSGEGDDDFDGGSYPDFSIGRWMELPVLPEFESEADARLAKSIRADSMALDV